MSKGNQWIVFVVLTMFVSLSLVGGIGSPDVGKYMRHGSRMAEKSLFPVRVLLKYKAEIGLTEAQVAQIEKLQIDRQEEMIQEKADIRVLELRFSNYLKETDIDRAKMEKLARAIGQKKTDMYIKNLHQLLDVKAVLTTEQTTKIEKLKEEWRKKRFERYEKKKRTSRHRG